MGSVFSTVEVSIGHMGSVFSADIISLGNLERVVSAEVCHMGSVVSADEICADHVRSMCYQRQTYRSVTWEVCSYRKRVTGEMCVLSG